MISIWLRSSNEVKSRSFSPVTLVVCCTTSTIPPLCPETSVRDTSTPTPARMSSRRPRMTCDHGSDPMSLFPHPLARSQTIFCRHRPTNLSLRTLTRWKARMVRMVRRPSESVRPSRSMASKRLSRSIRRLLGLLGLSLLLFRIDFLVLSCLVCFCLFSQFCI